MIIKGYNLRFHTESCINEVFGYFKLGEVLRGRGENNERAKKRNTRTTNRKPF